MPFILQSPVPADVQGAATFTALPPATVFGAATFSAQPVTPVEGAATFTALPPLPDTSGVGLLSYDLKVTGYPGDLLDATYTHNGQYEELDVRVADLHPLDAPTVTVRLKGFLDGALIGELPTRLFLALSQEPETDEAAQTTTFRYRNSFDDRLRGIRLDELIPWKLNPTENPCAFRQRTSVSGLVNRVMRERVDPHFVLEYDPFHNSEWIEGLIDYSTRGVTPQALWDATYGALGMVLHVTPYGTGIRLVGRWPNPVTTGTGPQIPRDLRLTQQPRYQRYQTPKRLTVKGAPHWTPLTPEKLLDWIGPHPDRIALEREIYPNAEWYEDPEPSGTLTVQRGFLKNAGQIVAEIEVSTNDVAITETVKGKPISKVFGGVATGLKVTHIRYDPLCIARPTYQETTSYTWAYALDTELTTKSLPGPGLNISVQVGDELAKETTRTAYTYSPQAYLTAKVTSTERIGSIEQDNAENDPGKRGPIKVRETLNSSVTERWAPAGGGLWRYDPGTSGQTLVPVYDKVSGEAVRTMAVTRATPDPTRITDQAPPSYDCRPYCEVIRDVIDDTGVVLHSGDAGLGEDQEVTAAMLAAGELISTARQAMANQWHRTVTTFSVPFPVGYVPGTWLSDGRVQTLRINMTAQDDGTLDVQSELTCTRLLLDLLAPEQAGVEDYLLDPNQGRAVMLARASGGALARVVTAWNALAGEPEVQQALITFRSGFPPSPGDELDWVLTRGQKEATSGRR